MNFDLIVIGSGIAGLSFAIKTAAQGLRVAVVTKKASAESNTNHAQGGIACVFDRTDDFEAHVRDTLVAGDGLCDEAVTRAIVEAAPARIRELIEIGVDFSKGADGDYDLTREGGHSHRRILHARDLTGKAIEDALLAVAAKNPNISFFEYHMAIDLITTARLKDSKISASDPANRVLGAYVLDVASGKVQTFRAGAVVLAAGGIGQVYQYTTNPDIATGDGVAMAYRAGAVVRNMEFVQFHPTAMYAPDGSRELISESVRGEGAILRDISGRAFMKDYDERGDLAPRDVVARAIDAEMKKSGAPHVWLDITHKPADYLRERFPHIYNTCLAHGIDMAKDLSISYLLDFYGQMLTDKQRKVTEFYYNDDLSLAAADLKEETVNAVVVTEREALDLISDSGLQAQELLNGPREAYVALMGAGQTLVKTVSLPSRFSTPFEMSNM